MVDFTSLANTDGKTTEEKLQDEIAGDDVLLVFTRQDQPDAGPFFKGVVKQGVTFEWVKNKVAENLEAKY